MALEQYNFGIGGLYAVRTDVANPTPVQFGTVQEVSVDMAFTVKELFGQNQAPVAVARASQKITGKAKSAKINASQWNPIFFGQTLIKPGGLVTVIDEGGPTGIAIPTTPFEIAVANAGSMSAGAPGIDLGVFNAATGIQMTRVASAPAAGQYAFDGSDGTYLFASADNVSAVKVILSYSYEQTSAGARVTAFNQKQGHAPEFSLVLREGKSFNANGSTMKLYRCIATKLSFGMKNEDFQIPEFEFSAFADTLGHYFDLSSDAA